MPRIAAVLLAAAVVMVSLAPSAAAQRDPFEPQIETGQTEAGTGAPAEQAPEPAPAPQTGAGVANTGLDGRPWAAVAFALIALGVGLVLVARLLRPRTG